jgi:alpha-amylase
MQSLGGTAAFVSAALRVGLSALAAATLLASATAVQAQAAPQRSVFVHLFEWPWDDIAQECAYLGEKGYAAVQVSPPNEHVQGTEWWTRYQPVSYIVESRGGDRAAFKAMVDSCHAAGVKIYVDAVINHTADRETGTGVAGTSYSRKHHPNPGYTPAHYHGECDIEDADYRNSQHDVQTCELADLPDLDTSRADVQQTIADYLNDLADNLRVDGFRIDAAKHMDAGDLQAILNKVHRRAELDIFQEVIFVDTNEAVKPDWYFPAGLVTEFRFARAVKAKFKGGETLASFFGFDPAVWNYLPSDKAVTFTDNHDEQRHHPGDVITFRDGPLNDLAHVFLLAWPYGYPKVMSSYWFPSGSGNDWGPPADGVYQGGQPLCNGTPTGSGGHRWICEHRWRPIANMVAFRNHTLPAWSVDNRWDNGANAIAFSRGDLGFVVINNEHFPIDETLYTGMAPGLYCNVIAGDFANGTCSGPSITVDATRRARFQVPPRTAAAIHVGARLGATPTVNVDFACANGHTYWGQSVYVVGNSPIVGNWAPSGGVKLDPTAYPTWTGTIPLPAGTTVEWKCIKREEVNPNAGIHWEPGDNNTVTTPASGSVSAAGAF